MGPAQEYLCQYNGYVLPGYVQSEGFDSVMNLADHYAPYIDGSLYTEEMGLSNKTLAVTLKVWETDYLTCKQQVEYASTILRSMRSNWAPLYLQYADKYYDAMVKSIRVTKQAGISYRTLDYEVEFECKPWLIGTTQYSLSGSGSGDINTDSATPSARTLDNGGWTPTIVTYTGGAATGLYGTGMNGQSTGAFVVENSVNTLIVNTEAFTATISGNNANADMFTKDYRLYVGPGLTTFTLNSVGSVNITWYDRWYI